MRIAALFWVLASQDSPEAALDGLMSGEPELVIRATEMLGRLSSAGKMDLLVPLLKNGNYGGRAAQVLEMMGPRSLAPSVVDCLRGAKLEVPVRDLFVRCAAARALGGIG